MVRLTESAGFGIWLNDIFGNRTDTQTYFADRIEFKTLQRMKWWHYGDVKAISLKCHSSVRQQSGGYKIGLSSKCNKQTNKDTLGGQIFSLHFIPSINCSFEQ